MTIKQIFYKKLLPNEILRSFLIALSITCIIIFIISIKKCPLLENWYVTFLKPETYEKFSDIIVKLIIGVAAATGAAVIFGIEEKKMGEGRKDEKEAEWNFRNAFTELLILSFGVGFAAILIQFIPIILKNAEFLLVSIGSFFTLKLVTLSYYIVRKALVMIRHTVGYYNQNSQE